MEVNEEEVEWRNKGETQCEGEAGDLDPVPDKVGRRCELHAWSRRLGCSIFGSWQEATSKVGNPTTTKSID